jgi:uncharacterized membrane protein YtjA (UPF0391 family)
MLRLATLFLLLAIVAGVFGLTDLATGPGLISQAIFFSLLGLGVVFAALEYTRRRP